MPKSKRSKLIALTKTKKKTREDKERIGEEIKQALDTFNYAWVFSVDNMRNTFLKTIRQDWTGSRLLFGRTKVMHKVLGATPEEEYLENLHRLTKYMIGDIGLLLTNEKPEVVKEYFESFVKEDFARAGIESPITLKIPPGIVYSTGGKLAPEDDVPLAHSLESTLRSLGMPTSLKNGKVELSSEYTVCTVGQVLNSKQTRLLKLFGTACSQFKVNLLAFYDKSTGEVNEA